MSTFSKELSLFKITFAFSLAVLLLSGCGSMPNTPDLMVENAKADKMMTLKDSFQAKRSLAQVTDVLKKKSQECLQRNVEVRWRQNGLDRREVTALTPKVEARKGRTRLTLQWKTIEGSKDLGDIPPDGWYMMVVDAYPLDKGTTRVDSYFQHNSYQGAFSAIKPWVTGTNLGCPDLTQ